MPARRTSQEGSRFNMPKVHRQFFARTFKDMEYTIIPLTAGADLDIQENAVKVTNKIAFSKKMELATSLRADGKLDEAAKIEEQAEQLIESKSGAVRVKRLLCCLKSWNFEDTNDADEVIGPLAITEDNLRSIPSEYFVAIEAEIMKISAVPKDGELKN